MECVAQKKSKGSNINDEVIQEDRIAELPEDVKVHILSYLDTVEAINTMLLRCFGNLWTQIPSLSFDAREITYDVKELLGMKGMFKAVFEGYASYVRNVLFFHQRVPIDEFTLVINVFDWLDGETEAYKKLGKLRSQAINEIRQWITSAIYRKVKVLKLRFSCGRVDASILPSCVFTSKFIVKLHIYDCGIKLVSKVSMESLKELSLELVDISNEFFKELISGCPSLQNLEIKWQFELDEIHFSAPNIEILFLDETNGCSIDCPNLKELFVNDSYPDVVNVSSLVEVCAYSLSEQMLNMFSNVEVMKIHTCRYLELEELDFSQNRWKRLHIELPLHAKQVSSIFKVLRSSLHLEAYPFLHETKDCKTISLELFPTCVMAQLKTVTLSGYKISCKGLVRCVEFLLKSAINLENMEIVVARTIRN